MEQEDRWQIIASGTTVNGSSRDEITRILKKNFGFTDADIAILLNGRRKTIKKGLDTVKAYKYKQALLDSGVDVHMELMPRVAVDGFSSSLALEPVAEETTQQDSGGDTAEGGTSAPMPGPLEMQCPKCEHIQVKAAECSSCGVIIARCRPESTGEDNTPVTHGVDSTGISFDWRILASVAAVLLLSILFALPKSYDIGSSPEALAQIDALRTSRKHEWPKRSLLRQQVESGDYYAVERVIRELHDQTMVDLTWEDAYVFTVYGLTANNGFPLDAMNRWVNSTGSAFAYMARGMHYYSAALSARGEKWASETSAAQFAAQSKLALKSKRDLEKALSLNQELIPAYSVLIELTNARGVNVDKEKMLADAIEVLPGTLHAPHSYLSTIVPKWGGSYPAMEAFVDDAMTHLHKNPRLWLLNGFAHEERANSACLSNDCSEAIRHYTKALEYGIYHDWLTQRAHFLAGEGVYEQALADVNLTLEIYPKNSSALELKPWLEQQL